MKDPAIIFENKTFRLTVGADAIPQSLVYLPTGEECLYPDATVPLFSVTQERPFNNEIKLSHPNTRTTYQANRLRREGDDLVIGFETAPYEAVVSVGITDNYISFRLSGYRLDEKAAYGNINLKLPPVMEFRLLQLSCKNRSGFGEWLNVLRDDKIAVCVLAVTPEAMVGSQKRENSRILSADASEELGLCGTTAALIVEIPEKFLDRVDALEKDFDLPRGVESRRGEHINSSVYFTSDLTPQNVDEHIRRCKQGGFRMMQIYYTAMFNETSFYSLLGNYDYRPSYPNGRADLVAVLDKIKAAGIIPGFHVLQTHIGVKSRYVTPVADHRLHLKKHYTLARPIGGNDTEIYVEESTADATMADKTRTLMFAGELIDYEGVTKERPYCFTGCKRGAYKTNVKCHPMGEIGGILDVSEFGAYSVYLDQRSSLADEISEKIADAYNAGFEFMYFDGSEGAIPPFGYYVSMSQYNVWKRLKKKPLYCEGAAKTHFGWHFLSGGNAFDVFPAEIFKQKLREHPAEEAPRMRLDYTRLNFGWWSFRLPNDTTMGMQADLVEYGLSRGLAWDCPVTIQNYLDRFDAHPRTDDILEAFRRWEDVRANKLLTAEQKNALLDLEVEHHLLINEKGKYEMIPYRQIESGVKEVRAFLFERNGKRCVLFWHISGACDFKITLGGHEAALIRDFREPQLPLARDGEKITLRAENRCYFVTDAAEAEVEAAFAGAKMGE